MATREFTTTSGYTCKVVFTDTSTGALRWWNNNTSEFEAYNAANIVNYGVAATEVGTTGKYAFTFPSLGGTGSTFAWTAYRQAGGSFATSDLASPLVGDTFEWNGDVLTSFAMNARYANEGSIEADVVAWNGATDSSVTNLPANIVTILNSSGSGGSGGITILTGGTYLGPVPADDTAPIVLYKGLKAQVDQSWTDYTGDLVGGETLTLRVVNLDAYEDETASSVTALAEVTAVCTLSSGTLSATFNLTETDTAALTAGAKGDGSTDHRLQVLPPSSKYLLRDRLCVVRRVIAAP